MYDGSTRIDIDKDGRMRFKRSFYHLLMVSAVSGLLAVAIVCLPVALGKSFVFTFLVSEYAQTYMPALVKRRESLSAEGVRAIVSGVFLDFAPPAFGGGAIIAIVMLLRKRVNAGKCSMNHTIDGDS